MGRPKKYKFDYPSVTEIVDIIDKPGLRYWYGKFGIDKCEEIKNRSQAIGHKVHKAIERFLKGEPFSQASESLNDHEIHMLSYLTKWCEENQFKPNSENIERVLYCHQQKFAGTPDAITTILVDWKTDSKPHNKSEERERKFKYALQHAGYSLACYEELGYWINKAYTVRISKEKEFDVYKFDDLTEFRRLFLNLREIYKYVRGK